MSQNVEPRAAIVGAGLMGRWHADAVKRIGGRVTVIVDPDPDALASLGRRHPGARRLPELDPSLIAEHATAAHVCTPLLTHTGIITRLIEARVNVLAEKPLTAKAEDSASLLSLATENAVAVCPVHQFLFQDGVRRLLNWLPALGTVRRVEFSTCSAGATGTDAASLDDLIAEVLPHPLSLVTAILGAPLAGVSWQVAHPSPGELRALATVGGSVVDIAISSHGRPTENTLRVVADCGSVSVDLFHGYAVRHSAVVSRRAKVAQPFLVSARHLRGASVNLILRAARREPAYPGLRELVRAFYAAVSRGGAAPFTAGAVLDIANARDQLLAHLDRDAN